MDNTWEYPIFEEEEMPQQRFSKKQLRNKQIFKNASRYPSNLEESCGNLQFHRCSQLENNFQDISSSSSSSDSEEEFTAGAMNQPHFTKDNKFFSRKQPQQMTNMTTMEGRKFLAVVELEGLRPKEVTAEVNPKSRILLIKLKTVKMETTTTESGAPLEKLVRVVALPRYIVVEKLQLQVVPRANCLLIKAPTTRRLEEQPQSERFLPHWVPIRVTVNTNVAMETIRVIAAHHVLPYVKDFPTGWISYDRFKRFWKQHQQRLEQANAIGNDYGYGSGYGYPSFSQFQPDYAMIRNKKATRHLPLNIPVNATANGSVQRFNTSALLPTTEIIFDEVLHKPVMLLKMNVQGFRLEEVQVRVEENQRVLIVEAMKKNITNVQDISNNVTKDMAEEEEEELELEPELEQHGGLTTKYLRREFCLPRFIDLEHIDFRVLKSGLLLVKLPMLKNVKNLNCFTCCRVPECDCSTDELKKDLLNFNYNYNFNYNKQPRSKPDWEKPLRA